MKTILIILFALSLGFAADAEAPPLPLAKGALGGDENTTQSVEQPEPTGMDAHWWRFFAVEGEQLEQRIQAVLKRLAVFPEELPEETLEAARPFIERIRVNLQALPEARAQPSPELPAPPAYAETYTISQLLDIAKRRRDVEAKLKTEQDDLSAADKTFDAANRRIDTLLAAYLNLKPTAPERVVRGLEIMAERSALAVTEEQLRVRRADLTATELLVEQLQVERAVAATRLVAEPADWVSLHIAIKQTRSNLEQVQARLIKEQSRALSVVGDDPEEKATARYRQQRVVRTAVEEAIATVQLLKLQVEQQLVDLLLDRMEMATQALRESLSARQAQLTAIRQQAVSWTEDSLRERNRASKSVAVVPEDPQIATPIKLINEDRLNLAQATLLNLQRLQDNIVQVELLISLVEAKLARLAGGWRDWLARTQGFLSQIGDRTWDWASTSLFKIGDAPVTASGILRVVVILTFAWWASYWLRRVLQRLGEHREGINLSATYTIGRLSHYLIITIGFMLGLSSIGIDFTNFALVAGAIGIGIGFGLQSIVNNFVSGLILLFERSLKVGDFVELASGIAGEVREINVRSTVINTNDNVDIVVPNSEFINTKVTNWTLVEGHCRIHLPFKVAYGTDKELVKQATLEAADKLPHTLKGIPGRNPGVWLIGFGESSLDFELVVWVTPQAVKRPGAVHAAYMWEIEAALSRYGIEIPYPHRILHLHNRNADEEASTLGARLEKS